MVGSKLCAPIITLRNNIVKSMVFANAQFDHIFWAMIPAMAFWSASVIPSQ
jgi:hypothetical protein